MTNTPHPDNGLYVRDMVNLLDGYRQDLARTLGTVHPLFRQVDDALRSWNADRMADALSAVDRRYSRLRA